MAEIIRQKRNGRVLTTDEINFWIKGVTTQEIPDYQTTAMLMAIYFKGMTVPERSALTQAMASSGDMLPANKGEIRIDKHSTGGVGDKTSLVLAPLLALFGVKVPMISGRGLGFTGGTLDKLDCIPGFNARLSNTEIEKVLNQCNCMIIGQTEKLAPADKKIYSLRDVTSTVDEISLITASILSKKLSENLTHLVMDVKCGSGAFMKDLSSATALAESISSTANAANVQTSCLITRMDFPLGVFTGNFCEDYEILEYIEPQSSYLRDFENLIINGSLTDIAFAGNAAHPRNNLVLVTTALAMQMIQLVTADNYQKIKIQIHDHWASGRLKEKFYEMVKLQGGNLSVLEKKRVEFSNLLSHENWYEYRAPQKGFLNACDGEALGHLMVELGAGRKKAEDSIDPEVSLQMLKSQGERVEQNEVILRIWPGVAPRLAPEKITEKLNTIFTVESKAAGMAPYIYQVTPAKV